MTHVFADEQDLRVPPVARTEAAIRTLHSVIPLTAMQPEFSAEYVRFVRRVRESLHPRGSHDVRRAWDGDFQFEVDLGSQLDCDLYYGFFHHAAARALFLAVLRPCDVVVDIDANVGLYSVPAAVRVGPGGAVHAFAQTPTELALLTRNVQLHEVHECVRLHAVQVRICKGITVTPGGSLTPYVSAR